MSGDLRAWTTGQVLAVDGVGIRLQVRLDGGDVWLPYVAGTYAANDTVAVVRDPLGSGSGQLVVGKLGAAAAPAVPSIPAATSQRFTAVIRPVGSASYRVVRSAWDRWTTIASTDLADLYQADAGDPPGTMYGLAWYGSLVSGLGATSIDYIDVVLQHNGSGYGAAAFVVQGSAASSKPAGAPSFTGSTVTSSSVAIGGRTTVRLPSTVAESMRTGGISSLGINGTDYGGVKGATHPEGMALQVSYWKAI